MRVEMTRSYEKSPHTGGISNENTHAVVELTVQELMELRTVDSELYVKLRDIISSAGGKLVK